MNKYFKSSIPSIITAFILGGIADIIALSDRQGGSAFAMGFFIILPLGLLILLTMIYAFNIKNRLAIVILSAIAFFFLMIFTFWFYEQRRGGYVTEMYGIFYIFGAIPSIIIGVVFGFLIPKKNSKTT